jgi:quercetin dioxygenase-like cupin family protein
MIEATALRALGILGGEPLVRLMGRLREGDEALEEDLREMERAASLLALAAPAAEPPADLKRRVLSRVAADGYYFLHERESEWEPSKAPGAWLRRLFIYARESRETRLVRVTPAASASAVAELAGCGFYLLSGDLHADGERLEIGDYYHAAGEAPTGRTEHGCVLFTVLAGAASRGKSRSRTIVRAAEGEWLERGPGITTKRLGEDPERGLRMSLLRLEPGASWEAHRHEGAEELFLVRGDWRCLGTNLHPGDYHRAGPGTEHEATTSAAGCKLIVVSHSLE